MKILNWNTQIASPRGVNGRFEVIQELLAYYDADLTCLTEAYPETFPDGGYIVSSELSGWGRHERLGARRVLLRSKSPWHYVDSFGSPNLPEGRFVSAVTELDEVPVTVIGMCIPDHMYQHHESWAEKRKGIWQGACEYLDALREEILTRDYYAKHTIIIGDYRLQIPPSTYPHPSMEVNRKREETFAGWQMPSALPVDVSGLGKPLVDHVALSQDFAITAVRVIDRFGSDILMLSDHDGVCIEALPYWPLSF